MKIVYDDTSVAVSQLTKKQVAKLLKLVDDFIACQFKIVSKTPMMSDEERWNKAVEEFDNLTDEDLEAIMKEDTALVMKNFSHKVPMN